MKRDDFPIFKTTNRNKPLIYLDSAASAQKPQVVIDAIQQFYSSDYANIHRGIYELSERATAAYEATRLAVQQFIHAKSLDEIIFVSSTTEAINLVAQSFIRPYLKAGDEIIVSAMEHHSNIVPWYLLTEQCGAVLKVIPVLDSGELDHDAYQQLFSSRTKLVAVTHASNVLGTINPIKDMARIAHEKGVPVLVDGAQAIVHMPVDVSDLDCDFYAFSAHKLYGPTGIGVLYAKKQWHDKMLPYQGGGEMIETVSFDRITFADVPKRFEAGTPPIASAIGLHAAIDYVSSIGMEKMAAHEQQLLQVLEASLQAIANLRIIGTHHPKVGVVSFVLDGIHAHDVGSVLDHEGIAVRVGHHCAMPLMTRFDVPAVVRVSLGLYNTEQEIEALTRALHLTRKVFG